MMAFYTDLQHAHAQEKPKGKRHAVITTATATGTASHVANSAVILAGPCTLATAEALAESCSAAPEGSGVKYSVLTEEDFRSAPQQHFGPCTTLLVLTSATLPYSMPGRCIIESAALASSPILALLAPDADTRTHGDAATAGAALPTWLEERCTVLDPAKARAKDGGGAVWDASSVAASVRASLDMPDHSTLGLSAATTGISSSSSSSQENNEARVAAMEGELAALRARCTQLEASAAEATRKAAAESTDTPAEKTNVPVCEGEVQALVEKAVQEALAPVTAQLEAATQRLTASEALASDLKKELHETRKTLIVVQGQAGEATATTTCSTCSSSRSGQSGGSGVTRQDDARQMETVAEEGSADHHGSTSSTSYGGGGGGHPPVSMLRGGHTRDGELTPRSQMAAVMRGGPAQSLAQAGRKGKSKSVFAFLTPPSKEDSMTDQQEDHAVGDKLHDIFGE